MDDIRHGVMTFQRHVYPHHKTLFRRLALGQTPKALFITCADSRVDPTLITHSQAGQLFVDRNPGNRPSPTSPSKKRTWQPSRLHSALHGENASEAAGIEYALEVLNIPNIIICGHTDCGAMKAVWRPETAEALKCVKKWLVNGKEARKQVMAKKLPEDQQLQAITERNVVIQLEHLKTYPAVAARLKTGKVRIAGWVYDIEHGKVLEYDPGTDAFKPLRV